MLSKIVTGYVPIQGHPRTSSEYGELGENLFGHVHGDFSIHPFYETLSECWLWKGLQSIKTPLTHSAGDNSAKNTLAYHCVQHQKFAWLLKAALLDPKPDTFVWMDYGIGHVPGVTPDVVNDFMAALRPGDFAIPGCWRKENAFNSDFFPCWRFCGGVMVVPRVKLHKLYKTVKRNVMEHVRRTRNVSWEVNTLARIEATLPIRWYQADHNQTLFTGYAEGAPK